MNSVFKRFVILLSLSPIGLYAAQAEPNRYEHFLQEAAFTEAVQPEPLPTIRRHQYPKIRTEEYTGKDWQTEYDEAPFWKKRFMILELQN